MNYSGDTTNADDAEHRRSRCGCHWRRERECLAMREKQNPRVGGTARRATGSSSKKLRYSSQPLSGEQAVQPAPLRQAPPQSRASARRERRPIVASEGQSRRAQAGRGRGVHVPVYEGRQCVGDVVARDDGFAALTPDGRALPNIFGSQLDAITALAESPSPEGASDGRNQCPSGKQKEHQHVI
jgi:hypothetical protein